LVMGGLIWIETCGTNYRILKVVSAKTISAIFTLLAPSPPLPPPQTILTKQKNHTLEWTLKPWCKNGRKWKVDQCIVEIWTLKTHLYCPIMIFVIQIASISCFNFLKKLITHSDELQNLMRKWKKLKSESM
jgi:hypothetical protein